MAYVRKCYNESCECNVCGAYCDADEIIISDYGTCESYRPIETEKDDLEV